MTQEQYLEYRKSKQIGENTFDIQNNRAASLKGQSREVALLLLNEHPDFKPKQGEYFYNNVDAPHWKELSRRISEAEKNNDAGWSVVADAVSALYPPKQVEWLEKAWQEMPSLPYLNSFRDTTMTSSFQQNRIRLLLDTVRTMGVVDFELDEFVQFEAYLQNYEFRNQLPFLVVPQLNANHEKLRTFCLDILQNTAEVGQVSHSLLKMMLAANWQEGWEAVGKLLIAAQRQDGIRQSVLSAILGAHPKAIVHILQIVLAHDLLRFVSVVRGMGTLLGVYWNTAPDAKTIAPLVEMFHGFLETPETAQKALATNTRFQNEHLIPCFLAIWALGLYDFNQVQAEINRCIESENPEFQAMALFVLRCSGQTKKAHFAASSCAKTDSLEVAAQVCACLNVQTWKDRAPNWEALIYSFEKLPKKYVSQQDALFGWQNYYVGKSHWGRLLLTFIENHPDQREKLLPYFDDLEAWERNHYVNLVFPFLHDEKLPKKIEGTLFERALIKKGISSVKGNESAFKTLPHLALNDSERILLEKLLTRKTSQVRLNIIQRILQESDAEVQNTIQRLSQEKDSEQRLAVLDILVQCKKTDRLLNEIPSLLEAFITRKTVTAKEQVLINALREEEKSKLNAENGWGLYNPANRDEVGELDALKSGIYIENIKGNTNFGFSQSLIEMIARLKSLDALIETHKNYEYEVENWDQSKQKVILGTNWMREIKYINYNDYSWSPEKRYENYPLPDVWKKWYAESGFTPLDLFLLSNQNVADFDPNDKHIPKWLMPFLLHDQNPITCQLCRVSSPNLPNTLQLSLKFQNICATIIRNLALIYSEPEADQICLDNTADYFASIPIDKYTEKFQRYNWNPNETWQDVYLGWGASLLNFTTNQEQEFQRPISDERFRQAWRLAWWRYRILPKSDNETLPVSLLALCKAHQLGFIGKDELHFQLLRGNHLAFLTDDKSQVWKKMVTQFPFLTEFIEKACPMILEIELKRGDTPTSVSQFATQISYVYGVSNFVKILHALGKDVFLRGYGYYYGNADFPKKTVLSMLLRRCYPAQNEDQATFDAVMKAAEIPDNRLIEAATYAPQWLPFVEQYLAFDKLKSSVWWLQAHSNAHLDAQKESEIAQFSSISAREFSDGAVDIQWFLDVYKTLGADKWQTLYNAAKYICDNGGHTRARIFADAMLGKIARNEAEIRISEKRNKDFVVGYGLIPLAPKPEEDILHRYRFLQNFKKESKQHGAQRQTSEATALKYAMDNLARTAGFSDPIRLTWAMETKDAQAIMEQAQSLDFNGITLSLIVDESGKAEIEVKKGNKTLKAIPSSLKKEESVIELRTLRDALRAQHSRIRQGLEDAMCRGDVFPLNEIANLMQHPVIRPMLMSLVLISDHQIGFWHDGKCLDMEGNLHTWNSDVRIAHCTDLYASTTWSALQKYLFDHQIKQPFKQVFRELYVPTADELTSGNRSNRYTQQRIQPQKAAALLKSRGWTVDYYDGLQKVYHKAKIVARIQAYADWFNASGETTQIEAITFHERDKWESVNFASISPLIFSEVMRDADLVVSVAHVGGVDPEAGLSTIEMRKVIAQETARLFKLDNLTFKEHHIIINGKKGEYSLHLGSGVVHQLANRSLYIVPVETQSRGRIFLPFMDEDPKTAEILSKLLLLAQDDKLQDPTILRQIR